VNADAPEELDELISVFETVFGMEDLQRPDKAHLQSLLSSNHFFAVVASADDRIIAGLTVYLLDQYYSKKALAYVFDLAVLPAYQRKGVGKKLMEFTNRYCRQKGCEEVFVQADKVDEHALEFYRSTQAANEEQVVHFSYTLTKNEP